MNSSGGVRVEVEELLEETVPCGPVKGTVITLVVATLPLLALLAILLAFKIAYRLCPQGERGGMELQLPRRISELSTSVFSMSRAPSILAVGGHQGGHLPHLHTIPEQSVQEDSPLQP